MTNQETLVTKLGNVGDAIRAKTGKSATMTLDEMPTEIGSIQTGGVSDVANALTSPSIQGSYKNLVITSDQFNQTDSYLSPYAFQSNTNIYSVTLPANIQYLGTGIAATAGKGCFSGCLQLFKVRINSAGAAVGPNCFRGDSKLVTVETPNGGLVYVNDQAFMECSRLKNIDFSSVAIGIGQYGFRNCTALSSCMGLSGAISLGAFAGCTGLTHGSYRDNTASGSGLAALMFSDCSSLKSFCFYDGTQIAASAFAICSSLEALVINNSRTELFPLVTLANANALQGTPISSGTGYVYVPDTDISSYQSATNWSTYSAQIKGLSELPQEYKDLYGIA